MINFKSVARRTTSLAAALSLLSGIGTSLAPVMVHADALNPLTKRSLTLSSSSPGWAYKDGSGNTTYAPPNSGANGQKTGETFSFNTSTDSSTDPTKKIKAFTFQFCTGAAGECISPGDDAGASTPGTDDSSHTDLNVVTSSPSELSSGTYSGLASNSQTIVGDDGISYTYTGLPKADNTQGNFVVLMGGVVQSGWSMSAKNQEDVTGTGKNNLITLTNSTGITPAADANIQVIFYGTNTNYITNPGSGYFFVKINDFNIATDTDTGQDDDGSALNPTWTDTDGSGNPHIVDGGVTVANVMNQSIAIQTKVLETMEFSVGTVDPDTLSDADLATAGGNATHSQCDPILNSMDASKPELTNVLSMGDSTQDDSLSTAHTYSTHSYWRLSSNSSAGATVYYSGHTLSNTEGDEIAAIGTTAHTPLPGSPQFGLALDNGTASDYSVDFGTEGTSGKVYEQAADNNVAGVDASFTTDNSGLADVNQNKLAPLAPYGDSGTGANWYGGGTGAVNKDYNGGSNPTTEFAFDANSTAVPAEIATEANQVVDCVTAKVRYIANIAATTPAGIYTTKINYIAAPQY